MTARTQRRGRHKVFIGMAPGVGKTCRMLEEAQEARRDGIDVVIGWLETHGRPETARSAEGLEQLPRRRLLHQGVWLEELDVAAVLRRHPQLVLVDELAHTNAPGSERQKRWQDVELLLLSGIDVDSTLNIQHLESLNDLVAELTGVVVRERLPNRVLERADAVVLVDVTPETLQERLQEGKVYPPETVTRALANFFQHRHLVALRELALREVADRVEDDVPAALAGVHERLLVCLSLNPGSDQLLRRAARLAAGLDARLLALTVQPPGRFLTLEQAQAQERCQRLCEDVGGVWIRIDAPRILPVILRLVAQRHLTQIVLGQSRERRGWRPWRRPLAQQLQQEVRAFGLDLHLLAAHRLQPPPAAGSR